MTRRAAASVLLLLVFSLQGPAGPVPVDSEAGRFRLDLPVKPTEMEQATPAGKLHLMVAKDGDSEWTVSWIDLAGAGKEPEKIDARLDAIRDRLKDRLSGKVTADRKVKLAGKDPGREVVLELPGGKARFRTRYWLVGDRLYQVSVQGPADAVELAAATKVFDSFALRK
jgi:hypothetical protein